MRTAEEMINFAKKYTPIATDEIITSFKKIESKIKDTDVIFAFASAFVNEPSSSLTHVAIAITDSDIFFCGRTNSVLSGYSITKMKINKIVSMELTTTNQGLYSNLVLNKNIRISMSSNEQAVNISDELRNIFKINYSHKKTTQTANTNNENIKAEKNDNIGSSIIIIGKIISYISLIGLFGIIISPFIAIISSLGIYISGLCLSGLGKIVVNTDELVRIARENKNN